MPIITPCACGKKLRTKDEFAGKRIKCPACGTILTVQLVAQDQLVDAADDEQDTVELSAEQTRSLPAAKEPFWANPTGFDNLVALTDTAVYVAQLGDKELNAAQDALDKGEAVWKVLKEAKTIIAFNEIQKVESNLQLAHLRIFWRQDKTGDAQTTPISCADKKARDEIMDALHHRLGKGWKMQEAEQPRLRAAALPLAVCVILLVLCFGLYLVVAGTGQGASFGQFFRQTPTVVLSLVIIAGCLAWAAARVRTPHLLLSITPAAQ